MGGKGSGRPKSKVYGLSEMTNESKKTKRELGKEKLSLEYRFRRFSYNQGGNKWYGVRDTTTGMTYKRMNEQAWDYFLRRLSKEPIDKVLSRMDIYTKEGIANRAMTAKGNIVSALNNMYDNDAVFTINGVDYTLEQIISKLEKMGYSEKWIDFANRHSKLIDSFFTVYKADIGIAPEEGAGLEMTGLSDIVGKRYVTKEYEDGTYETDVVSSDQYEQFQQLIEDIITTFKI